MSSAWVIGIISLIIIILFIGWIVKLGIKISKMYKIIDSFIEYNTGMKLEFERVQEEIIKVDKRGSFSSDDEIGFTFEYIRNSIKSLEKWVNTLPTDTETK